MASGQGVAHSYNNGFGLLKGIGKGTVTGRVIASEITPSADEASYLRFEEMRFGLVLKGPGFKPGRKVVPHEWRL
jgi:hypothetical protein